MARKGIRCREFPGDTNCPLNHFPAKSLPRQNTHILFASARS